MSQAIINPEILSWARQRAGLDAPTLARKLNIREDKLISWEKGDILPTFKQAQNYAHNTYIPFGYLFLKHPPRDDLPIPDLRTVGDHGSKGISINLRDIIQEVIRRQLWYQEYLTEIDAKPIEVVGSFSVNASVKAIVMDMKIKPLAWPRKLGRLYASSCN